MRLLHTKKVQLQDFRPREVPNFAILSHTWGEEEVTLQDIKTKEATKLLGYEKVTKACSVAAADGFDYIWIDTCCIDKQAVRNFPKHSTLCIAGTKKPKNATHIL
jgi:hypothetical protein